VNTIHKQITTTVYS